MALFNSTKNNFTISKCSSDTKEVVGVVAGVLKNFANNENEDIGGDALSLKVDDTLCNDSYDVSIGPAVVLAEHFLQSNNDTKRYTYQLNNTYYEAEVGFAAPDYWIAERTKHFSETGQYPKHTFEADYAKSRTKAIEEDFVPDQQPGIGILKNET